MKGKYSLILGIVAWAVSLVLVVGSLILSLVEGGMFQAQASPSPVISESETATRLEDTTVAEPTSTHTPPASRTPTPTPTVSPTELPSSTVTSTPTETAAPRKRKPTSTEATARCGPPASWVIYKVRQGDTLYSISQRTGASIAALQLANCMGTSTTVRTGQNIYVPHLPQGPAPTKKPPATKKPPKTIIPPGTPIPVTPKPTESTSEAHPFAPLASAASLQMRFSAQPESGILLAHHYPGCL
ncbi:MAG: LysM peptidoglycan-binding domain-containing protein [Chloroflexota bacterium]